VSIAASKECRTGSEAQKCFLFNWFVSVRCYLVVKTKGWKIGEKVFSDEEMRIVDEMLRQLHQEIEEMKMQGTQTFTF
jgi:hypothetical protein